ncbi:hypothetical protein [uncultured Nostoc sp.]|uniref:hypothetical protein n=1 Tax=uncultured Nostoc sp. TaxID=340711 RepID=UPI0035CA2DCD
MDLGDSSPAPAQAVTITYYRKAEVKASAPLRLCRLVPLRGSKLRAASRKACGIDLLRAQPLVEMRNNCLSKVKSL